MGEKAPHSQENAVETRANHLLNSAEKSSHLEIGETEALRQLAEQQQDAVEARESILKASEQTPAAAEALKATMSAPAAPQPTFVDRALKLHTLRRELQNIQRRESKPVRAFSKVVHQPVVRAVSDGAGKSVGRPSGLLGGGLVAFVGTTLYFFAARYYGFEYNSFIFILLFVGGFISGLVLEMALKFVPKKRS